jgi:hypothetical protein
MAVNTMSEIRPSGLNVMVDEDPEARDGRDTTNRFSTVVGKHWTDDVSAVA